MRHGVGGEVEDRLAVELEPFLAQRAAQPLDLVDALGHALRAGAGVGVDDHPVATAHLRLVHRVVGVGQHLQVAETIEGGDTGAGRDVDDLVAERRRVPAQRLHQLARDHRRLLDGHLGQQHRELVAAEARQHVGVPGAGPQRRGDALQHVVAGAVPERVVDILEVVEVEHDDCAAEGIAARSLDLPVELLLEAPPVEGAGEEVVVGQVDELALELLAVGDVLHLHDQVQGDAGAVADDRHREQAPAEPSPRVDVALLDLVARDLARLQPLPVHGIDPAVVRMRDGGERAPQQLALRVARDLAERGVDLKPATVGVDQRHADRRVRERALEPLLDLVVRRLADARRPDVPVGGTARPPDEPEIEVLPGAVHATAAASPRWGHERFAILTSSRERPRRDRRPWSWGRWQCAPWVGATAHSP